MEKPTSFTYSEEVRCHLLALVHRSHPLGVDRRLRFVGTTNGSLQGVYEITPGQMQGEPQQQGIYSTAVLRGQANFDRTQTDGAGGSAQSSAAKTFAEPLVHESDLRKAHKANRP